VLEASDSNLRHFGAFNLGKLNMFGKTKVLKKFLAIGGLILLTPVFCNAVSEQRLYCENGKIKKSELKKISHPSKGESNYIKITNCDISKKYLKKIIRRLKKIKGRHLICVDGYSYIKNFQKLDDKAGSNIVVLGRPRYGGVLYPLRSNRNFDCDKFYQTFLRYNLVN